MVDILFINPASEYLNPENGPPYGLLGMMSYLSRQGYESKLLDQYVDKISAREFIHKYNPKAVGITATTSVRFESFKIARDIKRVDPNIKIYYGGYHATLACEDTLKHISDIDIIVRGEGEETILDLIKEKKKEDIKGISYRKNGKIIHNPDREFEKNIDKYEIDYSLVDLKKYKFSCYSKDEPESMYIVTSRGCSYNCIFCTQQMFWKKCYRRRSVKSIIEEIERITEDYKLIRFYDDSLTLDRKYLRALCKEIIARNIDFKWHCSSRADALHREDLKIMKKAGCVTVRMGFESGSPRILSLLNKGITRVHQDRALRLLEEQKIKIRANFIYGLPTETMKDAKMTLNFIKKNKKKGKFAVSTCIIYPGSDIEKYAKQNGLMPLNFSYAQPFYDERFLKNLHDIPTLPLLIQPQLGIKELQSLIDESWRDNISIGLVLRKFKEIGTDKGLAYTMKKGWESLKFKFDKH